MNQNMINAKKMVDSLLDNIHKNNSIKQKIKNKAATNTKIKYSELNQGHQSTTFKLGKIFVKIEKSKNENRNNKTAQKIKNFFINSGTLIDMEKKKVGGDNYTVQYLRDLVGYKTLEKYLKEIHGENKNVFRYKN